MGAMTINLKPDDVLFPNPKEMKMKRNSVTRPIVVGLVLLVLLISPQVTTSDTPGEESPVATEVLNPESDHGRTRPILSTGTRFLPTFMAVGIAKKMAPQTVADIAVSIPVKKAVAITMGLDREFVAEVTKHLHPIKGVPIINQCPDELVVDVVKILLKQGEGEVPGRLADHLPPEKLISLSKHLSIPENIQVGYHMTRKNLIAKVLAANTDLYLIDLLDECIRRDHYPLIAGVVQEMDSARMIRILAQLDMDPHQKTVFLASLSRHLSPLKSTEIIDLCPDEFIADVVRYLISTGETRITGQFSDCLSRSKLVSVSRLLTMDHVIGVGYYMTNRALIAEVLSEYSDDYLIELFKKTSVMGYTDLIIDEVKAMDINRIQRVLSGLSDDQLEDLLEHYDGATIAQIIQSREKR